MAKRTIKLDSDGIRKILQKYEAPQAIAEYVWNGFDAKATQVEINYTANELGGIEKIEIKDNGYGIPFKKLNDKFSPFFKSEKVIELGTSKNRSAVHGKNGVGRLTFFTFANNARWLTVFCTDKQNFSYEIAINSGLLDEFDGEEQVPCETNNPIGTTVIFDNIISLTNYDFIDSGSVIEYLRKEFGWFLELNKSHDFKLLVNGVQLDYETIFASTPETIEFTYEKTQTKFEIKFINWKERLNKEYSKFYFIGSDKHEKWKENTTLNNSGDKFHHSLFIESSYFNDFNFRSMKGESDIYSACRSSDEFKFLLDEILTFLRDKQKPFRIDIAKQVLTEYQQDKVFPECKANIWERVKAQELEKVFVEIVAVEPSIFTKKLNLNQKKIFVRFLDAIISSETERKRLFDILDEVLSLDEDSKLKLEKLLLKTRLTCIVETANLIHDRLDAVSKLKELIFNTEIGANEVTHLQKSMEFHYWVLGEQYTLVAAAERKFEQALQNLQYLLRGDKKKTKIDHKDKNREMDLLLCRRRISESTESIENIVVELKHPKITLGEKELGQVKTYMSVLIKQDLCNDPKMSWKFYLIGNRFDDYIKLEIDNKKNEGDQSLVFSTGNYRIYVKTWSEIFNDVEIRYKFLEEKLKLEQVEFESLENADVILDSLQNNTAVQPTEIKVQI